MQAGWVRLLLASATHAQWLLCWLAHTLVVALERPLSWCYDQDSYWSLSPPAQDSPDATLSFVVVKLHVDLCSGYSFHLKISLTSKCVYWRILILLAVFLLVSIELHIVRDFLVTFPNMDRMVVDPVHPSIALFSFSFYLIILLLYLGYVS
jgi:hypothetical protein